MVLAGQCWAVVGGGGHRPAQVGRLNMRHDADERNGGTEVCATRASLAPRQRSEASGGGAEPEAGTRFVVVVQFFKISCCCFFLTHERKMPLKRPLGLARPHLLGRQAPPHPLGELVGGGGAISKISKMGAGSGGRDS